MSKADFLILGAGAIGSIIGAHLKRAGHDVVMLARGRRAEQLHSDGLRIAGLATFNVDIPVITDPATVTGAQTLIVATKTPGTDAAVSALRHADIDLAFSIQNGIWKNDVLAQAFGSERVLGSLANTSGELRATGEVLFTRNVNLYVGELTGGLSSRAEHIAHALDSSGVRAGAVPDMLEREWTKFVGWVGLMSLSVITRVVTWQYLQNADSARVLVRVTKEMARLADAAGVKLVDEESLLPQKRIIESNEEDAIRAVAEAGERFRTQAPEHRMSALQDVLAGRALEVHETLGHALQLAHRHGLALPTLETLYRLVASVDRLTAGSRA